MGNSIKHKLKINPNQNLSDNEVSKLVLYNSLSLYIRLFGNVSIKKTRFGYQTAKMTTLATIRVIPRIPGTTQGSGYYPGL